MIYETRERTMNEFNFSSAFRALTDYEPLRWQRRLYDRLRSGEPPLVCDLPTGLGKTSVIPIWLIAFASQVQKNDALTLPRRLIYIVNRRTVVDQATEIAEKLRTRILGIEESEVWSAETLRQLRDLLARATAVSTRYPIAISTLRGELADNEEWKADPARPAIIVGTIDMIGSKLLFSGYGDGYRMRPHHAGLIGQDALIVHDEAHLTPAFGTLLRAIVEEQRRCGEPRGINLMQLSATQSTTEDDSAIRLEPEDEQDEIVPQRLDAKKSLFLHETQADQLAGHIVSSALKYQSNAVKVLIYVRSPLMAKGIVRGLQNRLGEEAGQRVALLTGTIRGYERDQLVSDNPVYQALLHHESRVPQTVYLVSTSAGEVGIDLDADHMVSDLSSLDSMIQRLGRVNRLGGEDRRAVVDVILEKKQKDDEGSGTEKEPSSIELAEANTRLSLEKLSRRDDGGYDVSPRGLRNRLRNMSDDEREQAFAPELVIAPVTDILFDAWALTSVREKLPGRPEVAAYLHGITADPSETYVAWRSEIKLLAEADVPPKVLRGWFQRCRIEARERLRDVTNRVAKELKRIAKRRDEGSLHVVVLTERGEAELVSLQELMNRDESALQFRTIVLPAEAGGLTNEGILDGGVKGLVPDVAEADGKRARVTVRGIGNAYYHHRLTDRSRGIEPDLGEGQEYSSVERAAAQIAKRYGKVLSEIIPLRLGPEGEEDEAEARYLLLLVEPKQAVTETPESAAFERQPKLAEHLQQAGWVADKIATALGLEQPMHDAIVAAAKWHDRGKDRRRWQRAIFNDDPNLVFAKSGPQGMNWRRLGGYRHEFGSLLDAARSSEVLSLSEADLVLHLIAAHHGRARPHFDSDAWDMERHRTSENEEVAREVMRRYSHLQQRFGRWGLAWLESLVRCADVLASQQAAQSDISLSQEQGDDD
jgi:CRISPR-associated endonuclease/helicase Cas3